MTLATTFTPTASPEEHDTHVGVSIVEDCAPILPASIEEAPVGGRLAAYYTDEDRFYYFLVIDFDAGTTTILTAPPIRGGWGASVSPDGEWFAFETWVASDSSERRLIVLNNDLETEFSQTDYLDDWRPLFGWLNENLLLFNYFEDPQAILYDPFAGQQEIIGFDFQDLHPFEVWSRTVKIAPSPTLDQSLYPIASEEGVGIALASMEGNLLIRIVFDIIHDTRPKWSLDGSHVIFATFANEQIRSATRANLALISTNGHVTHYQYDSLAVGLPSSLSWSPENDHVAFWGFDDDGYANLFLFDIHEPRIINTCLTTLATVDGFNDLRWSLDGRYIAIRLYDEDTSDWFDADLAIYDLVSNVVYRFDQNVGPIGWFADQQESP